jgi:hypothetical protein
MQTLTVFNSDNHWREVSFIITGHDRPATWHFPAEYIDVEILSILACDAEGNDVMLSSDEDILECADLVLSELKRFKTWGD